MDKLNDQHYINLVLGGNTNAFAVLVDQYKNMVFTLSLKMLNDREEAEEAAQDTFIKVFKSLVKFKGDAKFSTWLYKITYNNCLDRLKKNKNGRRILPLDDCSEHDARPRVNVLDSMEQAEHQRMIHRCIGQLPPEDRFLLTLYYFRELSLKEMAVITGINENNVKIRLFRTRKKLAGILKKNVEPEIIDRYEK